MGRFADALVTTGWLAERMAAGAKNVRVFDVSCVLDTAAGQKPYVVRSGRAGFEAAHIDGAHFLDIADYSAGPDAVGCDTYGNPLNFMMLPPGDFLSRLGTQAGVADTDHLVLYTQAKPLWATRFWWMLYASGFRGKYSVLNGGLPAWQREGRPVASGPAPPAAAGGGAPLRPDAALAPPYAAFVGKEEVAAARGEEGHLVVHALPRPSFEGQSASYGRAGHIEGAVCLPFPSLLSGETQECIADVATVKEAFEAAGLTREPKAVTVYCGAGISATLPLFVALTQLRWTCPLHLYDGSLSEWCADEACPMATEA